MAKYIVKGEEGADVDIVGTIFKSGDTVELREDVAAPLVEAGTLEAAPAESAPVDPAASTSGATTDTAQG